MRTSFYVCEWDSWLSSINWCQKLTGDKHSSLFWRSISGEEETVLYFRHQEIFEQEEQVLEQSNEPVTDQVPMLLNFFMDVIY